MPTVIGRVADFPAGTHRVVEVDGREVGVFNIGGRLYGLANRCAHQGGPVCEGATLTGTLLSDADGGWRPRWALEGEVIACPWHGLEYHVPTGRCLAYPEIRLRRYEVSVRGDDVVVSLASTRRPPAASGR
jgi:nitrite reductase (NADH) small subunit